MGFEKYDRLVREAVAGHLGPGEVVEVTASAAVKQVALTRSIATGLAVAALSGGLMTVAVVPRKFFVAFTDRRMLFLEGNDVSGRPTTKIALDLPRAGLAVQSAKAKRAVLVVPTLVAELAVAGWDKALQLQFPTPCRDAGAAVVRALGGTV